MERLVPRGILSSKVRLVLEKLPLRLVSESECGLVRSVSRVIGFQRDRCLEPCLVLESDWVLEKLPLPREDFSLVAAAAAG